MWQKRCDRTAYYFLPPRCIGVFLDFTCNAKYKKTQWRETYGCLYSNHDLVTCLHGTLSSCGHQNPGATIPVCSCYWNKLFCLVAPLLEHSRTTEIISQLIELDIRQYQMKCETWWGFRISIGDMDFLIGTDNHLLIKECIFLMQLKAYWSERPIMQ